MGTMSTTQESMFDLFPPDRGECSSAELKLWSFVDRKHQSDFENAKDCRRAGHPLWRSHTALSAGDVIGRISVLRDMGLCETYIT